MNNINATIGLVQLETIEELINKYQIIGEYLDHGLKNITGLEIVKQYSNTRSSYWLYTLKVIRKNEFINMMIKEGFMASEIHKRNDHHIFLNDFVAELPNLDQFYSKLVHIPCGWWVSLEDCDRMIKVIKKGW